MRVTQLLRRGLRQWRLTWQPHAIILAYHRVTKTEYDPQLLCVSPANFADQLAVLASEHHVLSLSALVAAQQARQLPRRSVVITFDDGYADNFLEARPLLQQYGYPATIFVTSGLIDGAEEFWWDELERLTLLPNCLPPTVRLTITQQTHSWDIGDCADYSTSAAAAHRAWHVLAADTPTPRHRLYRELYALLHPLTWQERRDALAALRLQSDSPPNGRATHRILSSSEIQTLAAENLIEIGAHSAHHPRLSTLSDEDQQAEISASKQQLEAASGQPVTSFGYPYGTPADYTPATIRLLQQAGFRCACANFEGRAAFDADLFQLPRFLVRNWTKAEFAHCLRRWER